MNKCFHAAALVPQGPSYTSLCDDDHDDKHNCHGGVGAHDDEDDGFAITDVPSSTSAQQPSPLREH